MYDNYDEQPEVNAINNENGADEVIEPVVSAEIREEPAPVAYDIPRREKKKSNIGAGKIMVIALCCSLAGGLIGAGVTAFVSGAFKTNGAHDNSNAAMIYEGKRENAEISITQVNTGEKLTATEIYAANVNSTVGITTSVTTNFFGYQTTSAASGSGFILTDNGYIITNYHVIEDANAITVTTYNGTSYQAELIGYDESNDVAVLKIDANDLVPVVLGDSGNTNVGDEVIAIGNPLGELTFSLTSGSVSALDREVTINNIAMNLIQTDCAINSGNSGGALFNMYGEVIGITNAKYSNSSMSGASIDNIGFAIPINSVRNIFESIIEKGYISKPYVGISISNLSSEMAQFGLPQGAVVSAVQTDSPAEQAGLRVNDIITAIDGKEIKSATELTSAVAAAKAGDELTFTVYRQGETADIRVTVAEKQQSAIPEPTESTQQNENSVTIPWGFPFGW